MSILIEGECIRYTYTYITHCISIVGTNVRSIEQIVHRHCYQVATNPQWLSLLRKFSAINLLRPHCYEFPWYIHDVHRLALGNIYMVMANQENLHKEIKKKNNMRHWGYFCFHLFEILLFIRKISQYLIPSHTQCTLQCKIL